VKYNFHCPIPFHCIKLSFYIEVVVIIMLIILPLNPPIVLENKNHLKLKFLVLIHFYETCIPLTQPWNIIYRCVIRTSIEVLLGIAVWVLVVQLLRLVAFELFLLFSLVYKVVNIFGYLHLRLVTTLVEVHHVPSAASAKVD